MKHWSTGTIFYHIYPLGLCAAPARNDFASPPIHRLEKLYPWLEHAARLGCSAVYLGPVFESTSHGYDTADYYHPDRRLGSRETLARLCQVAHENGLRVILDAVFNHVGRDFWAFRDLKANRQSSAYREWFSGLRFDRRNRSGDPFSYDTWAGHESLVKLNLNHADVRAHLFGAVEHWVEDYGISGLRLDAADVMDTGFLQDLAAHCRRLREDFWLLGEVVHGDYRRWANPQTLDSVTNYECYKALYSSLNEHNYFEAAYALNRQFGAEGLYRNLPLYAFADNHDVTRIASQLRDMRHLPLLYAMLFSMPGVPSIYYGSEFGIQGVKQAHSDAALRPALDLQNLSSNQPPLTNLLRRFARLRRGTPALTTGDYRQLMVSSEQFAFLRQSESQRVLVAFNASEQPHEITLDIPGEGAWEDLLESEARFNSSGGRLRLWMPALSVRWLSWLEG